ncbi:f403d8b6-5647-4e1b-8912-a4d8e3583c39 [Thermothielavioides terrestris]|uniref:F403d8b6-5647-4e1b-8912-a4d8e3583c39 n=1 Tax=Thermothielavioides terrestris TaxID=2587410 RepID=A0A446BSX0_9PEZI|nr:f403d8b6-5647-4e1b-8912-a4d8e3583c39 [Thermothielavioides terrestris]
MARDPAQTRGQPDAAEPPPIRFRRFWRNRGEPFQGAAFTHTGELRTWAGNDLDIIIAPLDGAFSEGGADYEAVTSLYDIPDEFVWERERGVTHAYGRRLGGAGRETLWMHFLAVVPAADIPGRQPNWQKWGFVLTWFPKTEKPQTDNPAPNLAAAPETTYTVAAIVFEPPVETLQRLISFGQSANWTDATVDPFVLVDIALASWYHRVDDVAWRVTHLVREDEVDIFRRTGMLRSTDDAAVTDLDLHRIHTSAKNAIFMEEALRAAIRLVDLAVSDHESVLKDGRLIQENTHRRLRHRRELFHSTRLRILSCQARIKNTVDLAFHINMAHDSAVNLEHSRSVRLISVVGLVFIPFSAVTSVFGTQFFSPADDGRHMQVSADFWMLWTTALPLTLVILAVWRATERREPLKWPAPARFPLPRWWPEAAARKAMPTARGGGGGVLAAATELANLGSQIV